MPDLNDAPYSDPSGPDPEDIPDPMPAELQRPDSSGESRPAEGSTDEDGESMDGPAPTG